MVLECSGCEVVDDEELKLNVGVEVGLAGGLAMSRRWAQCVQPGCDSLLVLLVS